MEEICLLTTVLLCGALAGVGNKLMKPQKELRDARAEIENVNYLADRLRSETRSLPERMFDKDGNEYKKFECRFGGVVYSKISNDVEKTTSPEESDNEKIKTKEAAQEIVSKATSVLDNIGMCGAEEKYLKYAPQVLEMLVVFQQKIL